MLWATGAKVRPDETEHCVWRMSNVAFLFGPSLQLICAQFVRPNVCDERPLRRPARH